MPLSWIQKLTAWVTHILPKTYLPNTTRDPRTQPPPPPAYGPTHSVLDWSSLLEQEAHTLQWTYVCGHPSAPDDPFGEETLTVFPDGRVRLLWRQREHTGQVRGQVAPEIFLALLKASLDAGFPNFPLGMPRPGAGSMSTVTIASPNGAQSALLLSQDAHKTPASLFVYTSEHICAQLRGRTYARNIHLPSTVHHIADI